MSHDYNKVHYWYEDHQTGKRVDVVAPVYRFLYDLIQHIPPKNFRMVGRYGLYSRSKNKDAQKIINLWRYMEHKQIEMVFEKPLKRKKTYRERMIETYERDPIQCPAASSEWSLWLFGIQATDGFIIITRNGKETKRRSGGLEHMSGKKKQSDEQKQDNIYWDGPEIDFSDDDEPEVFIDYVCVDCG